MTLLLVKKDVCKWFYIVKLNLDGSLARLKVRLVAKKYSQVYGLDYVDTLFLVVKMISVQILLSLASTNY